MYKAFAITIFRKPIFQRQMFILLFMSFVLENIENTLHLKDNRWRQTYLSPLALFLIYINHIFFILFRHII